MLDSDIDRLIDNAEWSEDDALRVVRALSNRHKWLVMLYTKADFASEYADMASDNAEVDATLGEEAWAEMAHRFDKAWGFSSIPDAVDEIMASIMADHVDREFLR